MTQVDFYDKEQVDDLLDEKANAADIYDKTAIDAKNIGAPDDAASASGSLWARIKNAVARIINLETADANNVKKTGTSTVTGTIEVPTTPPTPTSVVNSVYVNDATAGVNNLLHKTGNEKKDGTLILSDHLEIKRTDNHSRVELVRTGQIWPPESGRGIEGIVGYLADTNGNKVGISSSIRIFYTTSGASQIIATVVGTDLQAHDIIIADGTLI